MNKLNIGELVKMKKRIIVVSFITFFIFIGIASFLLIRPVIYSNHCKNKFYEDISERINDDTKKTCVSFLWTITNDGVKSFNQGNSGVIINKKENKYFVATANHILNENAEYKVLFYSSISFAEWKKNNTPSISLYYDCFPVVTIEHQDFINDIAIVSFETTDNYPVAKISNKALNKKDRVFSIGCPNDDLFKISYGEIKNNKAQNFVFSDNNSTSCLTHNCFIANGSSGSPVFNDELELIGINIGGKTTIFNQYVCGYFIHIDKVMSLL